VNKGIPLIADRRLILQDKNDKVIAACHQYPLGKLTDDPWLIYGSTPMHPGDGPSDKKHGDTVLYNWARIAYSESSRNYQVKLWDGKHYHAALKAQPLTKALVHFPDDPVWIRTYGKSQVIQPYNNDKIIYATCKKTKFDEAEGKMIGWDLTIAPGIDPVLMLCITACLEYMIGLLGS
jgi:hypothetical protein